MNCPTCEAEKALEKTAAPSKFVTEYRCQACGQVFVAMMLRKNSWRSIFGMAAIRDDADPSDASQDATD
jgi:uncharacterized Zn finger protein